MMYRPGMGVDPWYENFKFFLTYWLLSSNNRDRMGDVDQPPPPPPPPPPGNGPQGPPPPFMSPHHKPTHGGQGAHQNPNSKSPNSVPGPGSGGHQINWDAIDKHGGPGSPPRHPQSLSLSDNFGDMSLKQHLQQQNGPSSGLGGHGNHGPPLHPNHQGPNPMMQPERLLTDKDRRHVCPHCYKGFRSRQQLNQHNLVHSNIRKYHCLYCERAFKQLSHLQQHHRIHTGEKPYRCPLDGCDKAFAQMSNLQHHMRQHDKSTFGQKHCMCPFCDRGYASEKSLKSHLSKMHPDSKMLGLGSPRNSLPGMMDGQNHPILGSPQPMGTISHRSLPSMHSSMKSPLTPPTGGPLELTVNSHQRNTMGTEGRKYSLDSNKLPLNSDMGSEAKFLQRSLSERLPDRDQNKFENMLDQRFGLQNHMRDMNRYGGRSFEPFSPTRFHDTVRSFDWKELESKLFDPSMEKFQRMAENYSEFRSRFQDQMFQMNRRDGFRCNSMPFDNRNMLQEICDRNTFFNSRGADSSVNNRDRFQNNRSYSNMNGIDLDNFNANRQDDIRVQSRNNEIQMNSPTNGSYNRPSEGPNEDMNMHIDNRSDLRANNMRMELSMNMRITAENDEMGLNRNRDLQLNREAELRNRQNGMMNSHENNKVVSLNQRNMDMNMGNGRMMMGDRNEVMSGRGNIMNHGNDMVDGSSEIRNSRQNEMDINDRNIDMSHESDNDRRLDTDMEKSQHQEMDLLDRGDLQMNGTNDMSVNAQSDLQLQQNNDMTMDDTMNMRDVTSNGNDLRIHSRGNVQMNMCNEMQMNRPASAYSDKPDFHTSNQNGMMMGRNDGGLGGVHEEMNMTRPSSIHQIPSAHTPQKQNGHDGMMQNGNLDFVGNENKDSPTSGQISDPNMIRQRKRKPANPQHVFMPSIDHYTSFASDEVEDCGGLM